MISMRTIIAGSRDGVDLIDINEAMKACGWIPSVVISGTARGSDQLGEHWAIGNSIPVELYPANWTLGKKAGYLRNEQMADKAQALVAIWDGKSRGTKHMIDIANRKGLRVYVHKI